MNPNKKILISKMYNNNAKAYSQEANNIVHEAINLMSDDNGANYIYIVPNGTIPPQYEIDCVLLVRKAAFKETVEVLAKAEKLEYIGGCINNVYYYGKSLTEYFAYNEYRGKKDNNETNITFKAECVYLPNKHIYLTNDNFVSTLHKNDNSIIFHINEKRLLNTSQRLYVSSADDDYKIISDLVNDSDLWNTETKLPKLEEKEKEVEQNEFGFMYAIGQQYNEKAYSNMFSYIFSNYPELFCRFCRDILRIDNLDKSFSIKREYQHIDLLIYDKNNIIVIENKIHSGINGIQRNDDISNFEIESQLSHYYSIITNGEITYVDKKGEKRKNKLQDDITSPSNKKFFIFAPEYEIAYLQLFIDNTKIKNGNEYKIISYKTIYEYYAKIENKDPNYHEFLLAIKHHIKSTDNLVEEQMIQRMLKIKHNT